MKESDKGRITSEGAGRISDYQTEVKVKRYEDIRR